MNILLFDRLDRSKLFPLTLTRAVADLRIGILTIKERWERLLSADAFVLTAEYLQPLYHPILPAEYLLLDASILSLEFLPQIINLKNGEGLFDNTGLVAGKLSLSSSPTLTSDFNKLFNRKITTEAVKRLEHPYQIFECNHEFLKYDYDLITKGRISDKQAMEGNNLINSSSIFIEEGANISYSILNAATGPIYIGKNATVMEGCMIRGPFALMEEATLKMGTRVYGATTLGPACVGGGELKNVVMFGYSNKAHDGYLGDSVIGEWCNFGAGTSNSNVKNTASIVKVWDYAANEFISAGFKCGLIMGDYSRTAINTSINTGTMVGVCCNIFGEALRQKVIPNFTWNVDDCSKYEFNKAIKHIINWKNFRSKRLLSSEVEVLRYIFENFND